MKTIKVELESATASQFEGYIFSTDLTDNQLGRLGFNRATAPEQIEASGEYNVEWDDDMPMAVVQYVCVSSNKDATSFNVVDLDLNEIDCVTLERQIENSGQHMHWEADRIAALEDRDWDR